MNRLLRAGCAGLLGALLFGCASTTGLLAQRLDALLPADVILLGEQHDARDHQRLQAAFVVELAQRGRLAALVLEMAERGASSSMLGPDAGESQVRAALRWSDQGWPWDAYAPVVMAAVRRGVPVLGSNLQRETLRDAMQDPRYDTHLDAAALARQRDAIRIGHCDLLPAARLMPMVRVQLARDASMAATAADAVRPGKTVLLIAGAGHVLPELGIPTHLPATLRVRTVMAVAGAAADGVPAVDLVWTTPALAPRDHCAGLGRQLGR